MKQFALCFFLAFTALFAQDLPVSSPAPAPPIYTVLIGGGITQGSQRPTGVVTVALSVSENNSVYNATSFSENVATPSIGFARTVVKSDGFSLAFLGDAGFATGQNALSGAFGGGVSISYSPAKFNRVPGLFVNLTVKEVKSATGSAPGAFLQIGKTF